MSLTIRCFRGKEIFPFVSELAALRINIFRDYPYLYEGDLAYEKNYIQTYLDCPDSMMVIVFDANKIVGVSTALPLAFEKPEWHKPFLHSAYDINDIFYFGESLLLTEYRGQGVYREFFKAREAAAIAHGSKIAGFVAVERNDNDPRKPHDYQPLTLIWEHFGYHKHPELCMHLEWQEIDEPQPTKKPLIYWLKNL